MSKVLLGYSEEELELVEKKLKAVNPKLFCEAFFRVKTEKLGFWRLLKGVWRRSKGNAVAFVVIRGLLSPIILIQRGRPESMLQKYSAVFAQSNKNLKKSLPKARTRNEKMFIKTFMELNAIGIEMNSAVIEEMQKSLEVKALKEKLVTEPTTENIINIWKMTRQLYELEMRIARTKNQKADIQDKVIEYERKMTRFDKRDIEDFWRAILTDLAISYQEQKILIVGTPIEILLKSNKMVNRIRKAFWLSEMLRESAKQSEELQNKVIEWFVTYKDKTLE